MYASAPPFNVAVDMPDRHQPKGGVCKPQKGDGSLNSPEPNRCAAWRQDVEAGIPDSRQLHEPVPLHDAESGSASLQQGHGHVSTPLQDLEMGNLSGQQGHGHVSIPHQGVEIGRKSSE